MSLLPIHPLDAESPERARRVHAVITCFWLVAAVMWVLVTTPASAQDLEPRAFSPAPTGMNFALLAYGFSSGNVFFDPAVPIEGAEGEVHTATLAYVRTIDFFGLSAKLAGLVPFAWGDWQGYVDDEFASTSRRGFADPAVQLAVNFVGAPAMSLREMASYKEGTVVGARLAVQMPLGQYDPEKLINLGTNRWTFVPYLGFSHSVGRWTLEALGSVRIFTENPDAYGDTELEQDPLWGLAADAIYSFRRGLWLGVGGGMGAGARTTVSGVPKDTYQKNVRLGATLVIPVHKHASVKVTYLNSVRTERGTDFDSVSLAYQARWGGGL